MPRPKTPSKILDARGAFKNHPERKPTAEPESPTLEKKAAPSYFSPGQSKAWREIQEQVPAGVLTNADQMVIEVAAVLMHKFRKDEATSADIGHLRAILTQLGMTPSGRASLTVEKPSENPFADF